MIDFFLIREKMATGNVLSRGVFIVAAKRTPFGAFGGSLKAHSPVDLQVDGFLFSSNKCCESVLYKAGLPEPPGAGIFVWSRSRFFFVPLRFLLIVKY